MSKRQYRAAEGVAWVNGKRVPENRTLWLTDAEAAFDLAHKRIAPVRRRSSRKKARG